jgi:hypothetical protein
MKKNSIRKKIQANGEGELRHFLRTVCPDADQSGLRSRTGLSPESHGV